jgi:hypothetical protein
MSRLFFIAVCRSPCPATLGTPLERIREESKTPEMSPQEERVGSPGSGVSRVLEFQLSQQPWVAENADRTVNLYHTNGVISVAEEICEDAQKEPVRLWQTE